MCAKCNKRICVIWQFEQKSKKNNIKIKIMILKEENTCTIMKTENLYKCRTNVMQLLLRGGINVLECLRKEGMRRHMKRERFISETFIMNKVL